MTHNNILPTKINFCLSIYFFNCPFFISLACRCAQKALQEGYRVFGLQFYGECWSGPLGEFNYSRDGASDNCIMNLHDPTACVRDEPKECVGGGFANYIYMVTESKEITIDTESHLLVIISIKIFLQYSSQIVETDTVSLEFSGKILRFLLHTVFPTEMCLLPPQC